MSSRFSPDGGVLIALEILLAFWCGGVERGEMRLSMMMHICPPPIDIASVLDTFKFLTL